METVCCSPYPAIRTYRLEGVPQIVEIGCAVSHNFCSLPNFRWVSGDDEIIKNRQGVFHQESSMIRFFDSPSAVFLTESICSSAAVLYSM